MKEKIPALKKIYDEFEKATSELKKGQACNKGSILPTSAQLTIPRLSAARSRGIQARRNHGV